MSFPIVTAGPELTSSPVPAFVVGRDGLYLRKRNLLGLSQTKVERVAHLPAITEFVEYELPAVPRELMAQVTGFFRAVWRLHRTEAVVLLSWSDEGFDLVVPRQKVGPANLSFELAEADVPAGARLVGSIHSHGAFGAYASLTDEDDEAELDGLHVVVGDLDRRRLSYVAAIVVDGVRFEPGLRRLIERPRRHLEPPEAWLRQVRVVTPKRRVRKVSLAERLLEGLVPPKDGSKPDRRSLDEAIARATELAADLGYRLTYELLPVSGEAPKGGDADA
jgi:hypothetical protein